LGWRTLTPSLSRFSRRLIRPLADAGEGEGEGIARAKTQSMS